MLLTVIVTFIMYLTVFCGKRTKNDQNGLAVLQRLKLVSKWVEENIVNGYLVLPTLPANICLFILFIYKSYLPRFYSL